MSNAESGKLCRRKGMSCKYRAEFLAPLIGKPRAWQLRNCWDFACHVQGELFGRELQRVAVPSALSKRWILREIERHAERARWREVQDGPGGLVIAAEDALVLMAHLRSMSRR